MELFIRQDSDSPVITTGSGFDNQLVFITQDSRIRLEVVMNGNFRWDLEEYDVLEWTVLVDGEMIHTRDYLEDFTVPAISDVFSMSFVNVLMDMKIPYKNWTWQ